MELLSQIPEKDRSFCIHLADTIHQRGGKAMLVGGAVRDFLLGDCSKDLDIEVFGLTHEELSSLLCELGTVIEVGKSFGVFQVKGYTIDIALPRTEESTGDSHQAFSVHHPKDISFKEASLRRDFTINAVGYDLREKTILDPWNGQEDLQKKILRPISPKFSEDPLRVLRAMQFIARFSLTPAEETITRSRALGADHLSAERIYQEWCKLLTKGKKIKAGLEFLRVVGWTRFFPELDALINCPQDPEWHPEGDVWTHTGHCLDAFATERINKEYEDLVVGFAVLCHDLGKPLTTIIDEQGRIRSPRHEPLGEQPTVDFLTRMRAPKKLIEDVVPLVKNHLRPRELYANQASHAAVRRLAHRVGRIDRLLRVCRADQLGRPPLVVENFPEEEWLLQRAQSLALADSRPQPIVQGRDLIALGLTPGKSFKEILDACFEKQLDGEITSLAEGKEFVAENYL